MQTGPSNTRLWSPTPLLFDALAHFSGPAPTVPAESQTCEPMRAADLGCGSGREAIYLAMHGWRVDAFDILPDALANVRGLANRTGVNVTTIHRDLRKDEALGQTQYDLVCMFRYWHAPLLPAIHKALRMDGVLAIEAIHPENAISGRKSAGRVTARTLAELCGEWTILCARDVTRNGRHFAQLLARRH